MDIKKTPQKKAGTKMKELSQKRREQVRPSKELFDILQHPIIQKEEHKKSADPSNDKDVEV